MRKIEPGEVITIRDSYNGYTEFLVLSSSEQYYGIDDKNKWNSSTCPLIQEMIVTKTDKQAKQRYNLFINLGSELYTGFNIDNKIQIHCNGNIFSSKENICYSPYGLLTLNRIEDNKS